MATVDYYVNPQIGSNSNDGSADTAGSAWATLQYALSQVLSNSGNDIIINCRGNAADTTNVDLNSTITADSLTILGNWPGGAFSTSHYRIDYAGSHEAFEYDGTVPIILDHIQIDYEHTASTNPRNATTFQEGGTGYTARLIDCYIRHGTSGTGSSTMGRCDTTGLGEAINCIFEAVDYAGGAGVAVVGGLGNDWDYWNCTFIIPSSGVTGDADYFIRGADAYNCVCIGTESATQWDSGVTSDYCMGPEASPTGTNTNYTQEATFTNIVTNYSGGDYSIKSGSPTIGAGDPTPAATPSTGSYNDDPIGTLRGAAWDIGAEEFVAAGGPELVNPSMSGVGTLALTRQVGVNRSYSGTGTLVLTREVGLSRAFSGVGTSTLAALKTFLTAPSMTGVGTSALVRQIGKALGITGTGASTLATVTAFLRTLSHSGTGTNAVTKQVAPTAKAYTGTGTSVLTTQLVSLLAAAMAGTGTSTITKQVQLLRGASGVGTATVVKQIAKTLASTAVGTVSRSLSIAMIRGAIAVGTPALQESLIAFIQSNSTATGTATSDETFIPFVPGAPSTFRFFVRQGFSALNRWF